MGVTQITRIGIDPDPDPSRHLDVQDLIVVARKSFAEFLSQPKGDVTKWLDLLRTCRQPQILWEVDYIVPKEGMSEIDQYIQQTEEKLYVDQEVLMKPEFTADINQQAAFNTLRAHHRSESDISAAKEIIAKSLNTFYSELSLIRQSNLLYHACLAFLCCGEFGKSLKCFERHWALLKYAAPNERISEGLHDNQLILQLCYWFFIKYVEDFRDFYAVKTGVGIDNIWNHKKISLLYFLEYDCAWAASCCGLPFYNHARTLFSNLPIYERKRSTPSNRDRIWPSGNDAEHSQDTEAVGREKYYFEYFNREVNESDHFRNLDKEDDYLYSYYHYQNDYIEDANRKVSLAQFFKKHCSIINTVVEAGCGIELLAIAGMRRHIGVDISEKVCSILADKDVDHAHSPIDVFLQNSDEEFDLCFACDLLSNLRTQRLRIFLENCSVKCKYLAAKIDTRNDFRSDILSANHLFSSINLHHSVLDNSQWLDLLSEYYPNIQHEKRHSWLYVVCSK